TVATVDPDPRFQASDVQINLQGVKRTAMLTSKGRQFARFVVPVMVRRETPSVVLARIYRFTLTFGDPDGEGSVNVGATLRPVRRGIVRDDREGEERSASAAHLDPGTVSWHRYGAG